MCKIPGIVVTTHCFISEPTTLDLANISGIHQPEGLVLEEHNMSESDFLLLPDRPSGHAPGRFRPIVGVAQEEYSDDSGRHIYRLSELRASVVSLLANLPAHQMESFCRRWSTHELYSPFQGWEHVTPEIALQICQEQAFQKLYPFLLRFQPWCKKAIAEWKVIYFLYENHAAIAHLFVSERICL